MHYSAKRRLAIACRLSVRVCLSVCDVGGLWSDRLEILHGQLAEHLRSSIITQRSSTYTLRGTWGNLLVVSMCGPPVSGSWSFRVIIWTVSVVGVLLSRARRPGIRYLTVFVTQHWVSTCLGLTFCEILLRCTERVRDILIMRCINLHFNYLPTYFGETKNLTEKTLLRLTLVRLCMWRHERQS